MVDTRHSASATWCFQHCKSCQNQILICRGFSRRGHHVESVTFNIFSSAFGSVRIVSHWTLRCDRMIKTKLKFSKRFRQVVFFAAQFQWANRPVPNKLYIVAWLRLDQDAASLYVPRVVIEWYFVTRQRECEHRGWHQSFFECFLARTFFLFRRANQSADFSFLFELAETQFAQRCVRIVQRNCKP